MAENYLEIQRLSLSYHAKQYQLAMLLAFNCINHMELRKFLVSKFYKKFLIIDMVDVSNKILWKNYYVPDWTRNMSSLLWSWNDCEYHCAFPYRNWKLYYTIIIIYVVVKHSGKISKNSVVGRIIWSRVNVFHEISRLRQ